MRAKYAQKRAALKAMIADRNLPDDERWDAQLINKRKTDFDIPLTERNDTRTLSQFIMKSVVFAKMFAAHTAPI